MEDKPQITEQIEKHGSFGEPTIPKPEPEAESKPPKRPKRKPLRIIITTIALGILFAVFCIVTYNQFLKTKEPSGNSNAPNVAQISEYPDIYVQSNLPEYPNAEVTSTGQKDVKLEDGVSVIVRTKDDIPTVAAFYDKELKKAGWKPDDSITSDTRSTIYYKTYLKGNIQYSITATSTQDSQGTDISITYVKK